MGKQGRVSVAARTELDMVGRMDLFRAPPVWFGALRMRCDTIGAVCVVVSGGRYMLSCDLPFRILLVEADDIDVSLEVEAVGMLLLRVGQNEKPSVLSNAVTTSSAAKHNVSRDMVCFAWLNE